MNKNPCLFYDFQRYNHNNTSITNSNRSRDNKPGHRRLIPGIFRRILEKKQPLQIKTLNNLLRLLLIPDAYDVDWAGLCSILVDGKVLLSYKPLFCCV